MIVKPGFIDTPMTAHLPKGGPLWSKPDVIATYHQGGGKGRPGGLCALDLAVHPADHPAYACADLSPDQTVTNSARPHAISAGMAAVLRYLALGGFAAAVNWSSRFAWQTIMPFGAAVVAAYLTGMVVAFVLFRTFVFPGSKTPIPTQVRNFILVNLLGIAQTWIISLLLVERLFPAIRFTFQPEAIGHAIAIAAPTVTSWFGHRYLTFADRPTDTE